MPRKHGRSARSISAFVEDELHHAMNGAKVRRQAREGAKIVVIGDQKFAVAGFVKQGNWDQLMLNPLLP